MPASLTRRTFLTLAAAGTLTACAPGGTASTSPGNDDRPAALLANMSLRQKIEQMLEIDIRKWYPNGAGTEGSTQPDTGEHDVTSMNDSIRAFLEAHSFGALVLFAENIKQTEQSFNLVRDFQRAATAGEGLPLLVCCDQEGGTVYRLGSGTALPGNMALAATGDVTCAKDAGIIIGEELSALGINADLAPVVDVNNNANNPVIGLRSFGDDPAAVARMGAAVREGIASRGVVACAKHFPGHGDTSTDSHYGLPRVDKTEEELLENELVPFQALIDDGVDMIMTAHILYPQLDDSTVLSQKTGAHESVPATLSKAILTDLLRGRMGFKGVVTTDALCMDAIVDTFDERQAAELAVIAGADLLCMPHAITCEDDMQAVDAIIAHLEEAVAEGRIEEARVDEAVLRILSLKEKYGILDWSEDGLSAEKAEETVGSAEHHALEREIAARAVTVVKNKGDVLPLRLDASEHVLVLVPREDEAAQMLLAWNRAREAHVVPEGATFDVLPYDEQTTPKALVTEINKANALIVVSEIAKPSHYASEWESLIPQALVEHAHSRGVRTVVISSSRPYDVQLYENADAIMAVYGNRGSTFDMQEARGGATTFENAFGPNLVAGIEVALGTFGATGTLPVDIPRFNLATSSFVDDVVYPRGYGITYEKVSPQK